MADVFIAYAHKDRAQATAVARLLERAGLSVWWDPQIGGGAVFSEKIQEELTRAKAVVVLWSLAAIHSKWVIDEASFAAERGKLVPVLIDDVQPPLGFRQYQSLDFRELPEAAQPAAILKSIAEICPDFAYEEGAGATQARRHPLPVRAARRAFRVVRRHAGAAATLTAASALALGGALYANVRVGALKARSDTLTTVITADQNPAPAQIAAVNEAVTALLKDRDEGAQPVVAALEAGRIDDAVRELEAEYAREADGGAEPEERVARLKQIGALVFHRDTPKAMKIYKEAYNLSPKDPLILNQLGDLHIRTNDPRMAYAYFLASSERAGAAGGDESRRLAIEAKIGLGRVNIYSSQYEDGWKRLSEARAEAAAAAAPDIEAYALEKLGALEQGRGDLRAALAYYEQALIIARAIESAVTEQSALDMIGEIAFKQGDLATAKRRTEDALQLSRSRVQKKDEIVSLNRLGKIALQEGRLEAARNYFANGLETAEKEGFWRMRTLLQEGLGDTARAAEDAPSACANYRSALANNADSPLPNASDTDRLTTAIASTCA